MAASSSTSDIKTEEQTHLENDVEMLKETYLSTGGVHLEGNNFQIKLLALFLKRGLDKKLTFKLATEWDHAEKFDDLIFMYKNNDDKWEHRFLQAKHKEDNSKKINFEELTVTNNDFDLKKYFTSYQNIVKNPSFTSENVYIKDFIICTNINFVENDLKENFKELNDDLFNLKQYNKRFQLLQFKIDGPKVKHKIIPALKNTSDTTSLTVEMAKCVKNNLFDFRLKQMKKYQSLLEEYVIDLDSVSQENKKRNVKFQKDFVDGNNVDIQKIREEFYKAYVKYVQEDKFWESMKKHKIQIPSVTKEKLTDVTPKLAKPNKEEIIKEIEDEISNFYLCDKNGVSEMSRLAVKLAECVVKDKMLDLEEHKKIYNVLVKFIIKLDSKTEKNNKTTVGFHSAFLNGINNDINKFREEFYKEYVKRENWENLRQITLQVSKEKLPTLNQDKPKNQVAAAEDTDITSLANEIAECVVKNEIFKLQENKNYYDILTQYIINFETNTSEENKTVKFQDGFLDGTNNEVVEFREEFYKAYVEKENWYSIQQMTIELPKDKDAKLNKTKSNNQPVAIEDVNTKINLKKENTELKNELSNLLLPDEDGVPDMKKLAVKLAKCVVEEQTLDLKEHIIKRYLCVLEQYIFDVCNSVIQEDKTRIVKFQDEFLHGTENDSMQQFKEEFYNAYVENTQHIEKEKFWQIMKEKTLQIPSDATWKLFKLNNSEIDAEEVNNFFKKLVFAVNVPNENELGHIIASELHKEYNGIKKCDIEGRFKTLIENWIQDTPKTKQKNFLTNVNGRNFLCSLARTEIDSYTSKYCAEIKKHKKFFKEEFKHLNIFLNSNKQVFNLITKSSTTLGLIKVINFCTDKFQLDDPYYPVCISFSLALETETKLVEAFSSTERNNLLIIECKNSSDELEPFRVRILKIVLANKSKKIIFITQQVLNEATIFNNDVTETFQFDCRFNDLSDKSQNDILQKKIQFQGKEVKLYLIVDKDLIDDEVLSKLIDNKKVKIGKPLENLNMSYYIGRTFICHNIFSKFIIDTNPEFYVTSNTQIENANDNQDIVIISDIDEYFLYLRKKYDKRNIHWFKGEENSLILQQSHGDLSKLRILKQEGKLHKNTIIDINDRIVIVAAESGMGKSTVLTYLAEQTKNSPDSYLWIVRINLNDYTDYIETCEFKNIDEALHFLLNTIESKSTLETKLFKRYIMQSSNVVLLFDGFDEICPLYKEKIIKLLTLLKETQVKKLWVTTRLHLNVDLENKLNTFSFKLKPFSREDQKRFFKKYLNQSNNSLENKASRDAFINKLLDALNKSLNYDVLTESYVQSDQLFNDAKTKTMLDLYELYGDAKFQSSQNSTFVSIPLQTKMLAEVYENDYKEYLKSNNMPEFKETLDLNNLYERFISNKFNIYFREKMKLSMSNVAAKRLNLINQTQIRKKLQVIAVNALFPTMLKNDLSTEEYEELLGVGLLHNVNKNKPEFMHRSFAEYFAALWLSDKDNLRNTEVQTFILEDIFMGQENVIFNFFDRMIIGRSEIHTAVINNDKEKVNILKTQKDIVNSKDKLKRTPLHLAVIYGYEEIVEILLKFKADIACNDEILDWSPLVYAAQMEKWDIATLLMSKEECSHDLKKVRVDLQEKTFDHYEQKETLLHFAIFHKLDINTITSILQKSKIVNTADGNGNTPLHLAVQHGYTSIVVALLKKGAMYNSPNIDNKTPMELVENNEELKNIFNLIKQLFSIKKKNNANKIIFLTNMLKDEVIVQAMDLDRGNILHYFAEIGHCKAIETLITHVRNNTPDTLIQFVNAKNIDGQTPVHIAAIRGEAYVLQYLFDNNADVNTKDVDNNTPLHIAAEHGYCDVMEILITNVLNNNPDTLIQYVNFKNKDGDTPLYIAAYHGRADALQYLLDNNADLNTKDIYNNTSLHNAVKDSYFDVMETLITHVRNNNPDTLTQYVNSNNKDGETPLHCATWYGEVNAVQYLLDNNANLNTKDINNRTPLHNAAEIGNCEAIETLITHVRNNNPDTLIQYVNSTNMDGRTPLHCAAIQGDVDVVLCLLDNNAYVNTRDIHNNTPLHDAAERGHCDVVETLITHVRDNNPDTLIQYLNSINKDGRTPLHCAVLCDKINALRYLLDSNANVNTKDINNRTPLHDAAERVHCDVMKSLITHVRNNNPDTLIQYLNSTNKDGRTPLHCAALCGKIITLRYLLDNNADLNTKDISNRTPLHAAIECGHCDVMEILITHVRNNNPDILIQYLNSTNKDNRTPIHYAACISKVDAARCLLDNNADVYVKDINNRTPLHNAAERGHCDVMQILITHVRNHNPDTLIQYLNAQNKDGNTSLHIAAYFGKVDVVRYLLDNNADVNIKDIHNNTPLHIAAERGHCDVMQTLIKHVRDNNPDTLMQYLNSKNIDGRTSLYIAAYHGKVNALKYLLDIDTDVITRNINKRTPLHDATERDHWDVIETLIAHVRNNNPDILIQFVNSKDKDGATSLQYAAIHGEAYVLQYLLDNNADVNTKNIDNLTPLHYAAYGGHCHIVEILITHIRNNNPHTLTQYVNSKNTYGQTALLIAAWYGKVDVVRYLLDNNADVNTKNMHNNTPLHVAAERGHCDIVETLITHVRNNNPDTLIQYLNFKDNDGDTALHCAVFGGKVDTFKYLFDNNADLNTENNNNQTPLHESAAGGHCGVMKTLITHVRNHNPDTLIQYVNFKDKDGATPLHYAAFCGKVDALMYLLDNNADVNAKDINNRTPLHDAADCGHFDVVNILKSDLRYNNPDTK